MSTRGGDSPNGAALFEAANKLRGSVESAEYKHLVLGLIFLKYISDAFEQRRQQLDAELSDPAADGAGGLHEADQSRVVGAQSHGMGIRTNVHNLGLRGSSAQI